MRKAEVDEDGKESRLQELKDWLGASESEEVAEFQEEIETLEARIEELIACNPGTSIQPCMHSGPLASRLAR